MVSEMMLQQTQVSRVIPVYTSFITQFPTPHALADASLSDVLRAWKGMGYNRRAKYLQDAAKEIVQTYGGVVPDKEHILRTLPGIGAYTAAAICVFSYEQDVVVIDTNIRQIIEHIFFRDETQPMKMLTSIASQLLPQGRSWDWYQALMDYGALELKQIERPKKKKKKSIPFTQSDRYVRGKIIDMLRDGDQTITSINHHISLLPYGSNERTMKILSDLIGEGLVTKDGSQISLPE